MNPLFASAVVCGLPMMSFSLGTVSAISKMDDLGHWLDDWVRRPSHVVYSDSPSVSTYYQRKFGVGVEAIYTYGCRTSGIMRHKVSTIWSICDQQDNENHLNVVLRGLTQISLGASNTMSCDLPSQFGHRQPYGPSSTRRRQERT